MKIEGLAKLERRLDRIPRNVRAAAEDAIEAGSEEIAAEAGRLVPEDDGLLRRSIEVTDSPGRKLSKTVSAGNESTIVTNESGGRFQNARIQEFGSKNMPANPFFFVAYRRLKRRVKSRITRDVRKAIRKG